MKTKQYSECKKDVENDVKEESNKSLVSTHFIYHEESYDDSSTSQSRIPTALAAPISSPFVSVPVS
jgi:hypothetical protein